MDDLLSRADREALDKKGRLVDLIKYLREDKELSFDEIAVLLGRTNVQMWFRRRSKTLPNMESLERIGIVAGKHHTGKPWTLEEMRHYLETGEFPKAESEGIQGIIEQLPGLSEPDTLRVIEMALRNLATTTGISKAINLCSSALVKQTSQEK